MSDTIKLYSVVEASLVKQRLLRGSIPALTGIILLVLSGAFMPADQLSRWGFAILAATILLITWGLLPYRRLSYAQANPHSLELSSDGAFCYRGRRKTPILTVPFASVADIRYVDEATGYGIGIQLRDPAPEPVVVHDPPIDMAAHRASAQAACQCDLFFPLFDRTSYDELRACIDSDEDG